MKGYQGQVLDRWMAAKSTDEESLQMTGDTGYRSLSQCWAFPHLNRPMHADGPAAVSVTSHMEVMISDSVQQRVQQVVSNEQVRALNDAGLALVNECQQEEQVWLAAICYPQLASSMLPYAL